MPDMDFEGAQAALEAAGLDGPMIQHTSVLPNQARDERGRFTAQEQPAQQSNEVPAVETQAPPAPGESQTEEAPAFTHIADESLTPELLQMKRSLQADYTRKTQEAAPWRKMASEFGVESPEQVRDAMQVYSRIQNPANWPQIHQELSQYLQSYGMSPAEAQQAATQQLVEFAPSQDASPEFDQAGGYDPQLVQVLRAQQNSINQLQQMFQQQQAQAQQQQHVQRVAENLSRMELQIRQSNPGYTDADIEAIYHLTGQDGNMFAAQQQYESLLGSRLQSILQNKGQAHQTTPRPIEGTAQSEQPQQLYDPTSDVAALDQVHRKAMAHLQALEAAEGVG